MRGTLWNGTKQRRSLESSGNRRRDPTAPHPTFVSSLSATYLVSVLYSIYISSNSAAIFNSQLPLFNPAVSHRNDVRSREDLQTKKEAKVREMENKKLEDYLDPALLSAVSSKIGRQKKDGEMKKLKREIQKFQWPVDELKVFVNDSRMEKTMDWSSDEVVDLKDDNGID